MPLYSHSAAILTQCCYTNTVPLYSHSAVTHTVVSLTQCYHSHSAVTHTVTVLTLQASGITHRHDAHTFTYTIQAAD